jgi:ShK domain-like
MTYSAVSNEEAYVDSDGSISINCQNEYEECEDWARSGECKKNPTFMLLRCSKACQMCGKSDEEVGSEILSSLEELKELKRQEEE